MKIIVCDTSANHLLLGEANLDADKLYLSLRILPVPRERDDWLAVSYARYFPHESEFGAYALGQGPGSFTALRMSFAFFKTLALLSEKKVFTFSSPVLWRNIFALKQNDIFLQKINRTLYYAHFYHQHQWNFLSGTLGFLKESIARVRGEQTSEFYVWDEIWRKKGTLSAEQTFDPNMQQVSISEIAKPGTEFSLVIEQPFLVASDWLNATPDYGHELTYITQEQQKQSKL